MSPKFLWEALLIAAIFALLVAPNPVLADTTAPYDPSSSCSYSGGFCESSIFGYCNKGEVSLGRKDCGFARNCCKTSTVVATTPAPIRTPFGSQTVVPSSSCLDAGGFCESSIFGCRNKGEVSLGKRDCGFAKNCCKAAEPKTTSVPTLTSAPTPVGGSVPVSSSCVSAGGFCESSFFGCLVSGEVSLGKRDCGFAKNCCKAAAPKSVCGNDVCETGSGKENNLNCPADCPAPSCPACHTTATPTSTTANPCAGKTTGTYCNYYPCITGSTGGSCPGYCKNNVCVSGTPTPACTDCHTTAAPTATPKVTATPTPAPACSDTDTASAGTTAIFNYDAKGTCTDTGSTAICPYGCADACASGSENKVGGALNEYYCYSKRCYLKTYACPSTQMCSSGRCVPGTAPTSTPTATPTKTPTPVPTATPSCSDTDTTAQGPGAYDAKGTCTDTGSTAICASGCPDACSSSSEGAVGGALNEYYCYAKRCYLKQYSCTSTQKCSAGKCVPA